MCTCVRLCCFPMQLMIVLSHSLKLYKVPPESSARLDKKIEISLIQQGHFSHPFSSKVETQQGMSVALGWLTVGTGKTWKREGRKRGADQQDGQRWQKHQLQGTGGEKVGARERAKSDAGNDTERGWTQTEIGGTGNWSQISVIEIRGTKRQMRNRPKMRKEGRKNGHRHWWSKSILAGERFKYKMWQGEWWMPEIREEYCTYDNDRECRNLKITVGGLYLQLTRVTNQWLSI